MYNRTNVLLTLAGKEKFTVSILEELTEREVILTEAKKNAIGKEKVLEPNDRKCYRCGKHGFFKRECKVILTGRKWEQPKLRGVHTIEEDADEILNKHDLIYINK